MRLAAAPLELHVERGAFEEGSIGGGQVEVADALGELHDGRLVLELDRRAGRWLHSSTWRSSTPRSRRARARPRRQARASPASGWSGPSGPTPARAAGRVCQYRRPEKSKADADRPTPQLAEGLARLSPGLRWRPGRRRRRARTRDRAAPSSWPARGRAANAAGDRRGTAASRAASSALGGSFAMAERTTLTRPSAREDGDDGAHQAEAPPMSSAR